MFRQEEFVADVAGEGFVRRSTDAFLYYGVQIELIGLIGFSTIHESDAILFPFHFCNKLRYQLAQY